VLTLQLLGRNTRGCEISPTSVEGNWQSIYHGKSNQLLSEEDPEITGKLHGMFIQSPLVFLLTLAYLSLEQQLILG
jgi:hypothetical protein